MKIILTIPFFFLSLFITGYSQESTAAAPSPLETLSNEYCGCVTRLGRIISDPEEAMAGCMRIFTLGNPNFAAAESEAYQQASGDDFSLRQADWDIVGKCIDRSFEHCGFAQKRLEASQHQAVRARLLESRKSSLVDRLEEDIAQKMWALILEGKWDELGIYHDHSQQYEKDKIALKESWAAFFYNPEVHTYTSEKEATADQLVFAYKFYEKGRSGIALQVQIRFKLNATFEKVVEIWIGS